MNRFTLAVASTGLVVALTGCPPQKKGGDAGKPTLGVRVAEDGEVAKVTGSPDGKWVGFLGQLERPRDLGVPEGLFLGLLEVVPADHSKPAHPLLGGVTNLQGGFAFSPDSQVLAALKGYRFPTHTGTLEVVKLDGTDPVHLADDCSSFLFSPDGKHLAYVAASGAFVANVDGQHPRKLAESAATLEFSRDSQRLLVRRTATAGGELLLVDVNTDAPPREMAKAVGDYGFSPNGGEVAYMARGESKDGWSLFVAPLPSGAVRKLSEDAARFVFAPDGQWVAFISGITPSHRLGDLMVSPSSGSAPPVKVGDRVQDFQFSPSSKAVALLEKWNDNGNSGTLSLEKLPPAAPPMAIKRPVMHFEWSPEGNFLAFTAITVKPSYSVDLELLPLDQLKPGEPLPDGGAVNAMGAHNVANGTYSFEFLSEQKLLYKTDCVMQGRACDLYVVPTDKVTLPARITGGVWRFQVSKDGTRMLVTYPRVDSETVANLGAINLLGYGGVVGLDQKVEPGAAFLDPQGKRATYGVIDKVRKGVYVVDVPLPDPSLPVPDLSAPGMKRTYATSGGAAPGPAPAPAPAPVPEPTK